MLRSVWLAVAVVSVCASAALAEPAPIIVPPPPTTVTFGPIVSNGAPFSVDVTTDFPTSSTPLSFFFGTAPAGVTNLSVTPASALSPAKFTASGRVSYSTNKSTVVIPIGVTDGTSNANGSITLIVVPEPATASLLVGGLALASRRRR